MDLKEIEDFPSYLISPDGTIYNAENGLRRKPSRTRNGSVKITLHRNGIPYTRSVALLVANAYLWNDFDPSLFDTPIHLDNDQKNNHVENLAWRPRWFAVRYQRQYWNPNYRHATTVVEDVNTEIVYSSLVEVCQTFGLLYVDVINSCTRHEHVFPTWQYFRFV